MTVVDGGEEEELTTNPRFLTRFFREGEESVAVVVVVMELTRLIKPNLEFS
jgi:hypothetical protein